MTALTASFAGRTVLRVGYGAAQLERLHDRRGEAVALLRRAVELGVNHVDHRRVLRLRFRQRRDPRDAAP